MAPKKIAPSRRRLILYNVAKQYCTRYQDEAIVRIVSFNHAVSKVIEFWSISKIKILRQRYETQQSKYVTILQSLVRRNLSMKKLSDMHQALLIISSAVRHKKSRKESASQEYMKAKLAEQERYKSKEEHAANLIQNLYRRSFHHCKRIILNDEYHQKAKKEKNLQNLNAYARTIQKCFHRKTNNENEHSMDKVKSCLIVLQNHIQYRITKKIHFSASIIASWFRKYMRVRYSDTNQIPSHGYDDEDNNASLSFEGNLENVAIAVLLQQHHDRDCYCPSLDEYAMSEKPISLIKEDETGLNSRQSCYETIELCEKVVTIQRAFRRRRQHSIITSLRTVVSFATVMMRKRIALRRKKAVITLQCFVRCYQALIKVFVECFTCIMFVLTSVALAYILHLDFVMKTDSMRINLLVSHLQKLHTKVLDIKRNQLTPDGK